MKKSLIALAALATVATAAQAQSSVTIYGVLDSGITRVSNVGATAPASNTGLTDGGLSTPRWGFRGAEDLGGGLKAGFVLESEFKMDSGAATSTLFNRASYVNLAQDGIGSIQLGHMNRQDYNMSAKYDTFGGNNIGGWIASNTGTVDLNVAVRVDNAVQLQTASLGGLVLTYQHAYGEVPGEYSRKAVDVFGGEYTSGPFAVAATYSETAADTTAALKTKNTSIYAKYDFKVVDLRFGYAKKETEGSSHEPSGYFIGAKAPITKQVNILAQYNSFDSDAGTKPTTYALGATYEFSKRTTAYLIGAKSNQDGTSAQRIVSTSKYLGFSDVKAGVNQTAYSVGIRHTF